LVVDDEPDIANLIRRYLERAGYQVRVARDGAEALRLARTEQPDLVTLDIMLPDVDGLTVLERLKSDPATAAVPVMLLSIVPDEGQGKLLGAVDYLAKPIQRRVLLARVRRILADDRPRLVLVADDDADTRGFLAGRLRRVGYQVVEAADGAEAVALAKQEQPGLVLMDIRMPGMDGIAALQALRAAPETRHLPVVMMTASQGMLEYSRSAIEALGGSTLRLTPCTAEELAAAIVQGLAQGGRA
jgi:CheY-like chemotaxis protein